MLPFHLLFLLYFKLFVNKTSFFFNLSVSPNLNFGDGVTVGTQPVSLPLHLVKL